PATGAARPFTAHQLSAPSTATDVSTPSVVRPPPTASTLPSGRIVSVWWPRGKAIGSVSRHAGDGEFISMTYVVLTVGDVPMSTSDALPDFITRPGRYMTAAPPWRISGSTTVHSAASTSRTYVAIGSSSAAGTSSRLSGSRNRCGYVGMN